MIGIDAVAEAMGEASRRAAVKPARGGVANAMFLCAAAETMPGPLAGAADEIRVNYPWGSLLRALVMPDADVLARLAAAGKTGAAFTALINVQPLRDAALARRLGLEGAALLSDGREMAGAYRAAGLEGLHIRDVTDEPAAETSWAKHLSRSKRETWRLDASVSTAD